MKNWFYVVFASVLLSGCGVYSFTGASVSGKTIFFQTLENRTANVVPTLSPTLTQKIRNRILTQTGLAATPTPNADYEMSGAVTGYSVSISGLGDPQQAQASQNRLTISVEIDFKNKIDSKSSFKQTFSRFADFPANTQLQSVEGRLIEDISNQLSEDIFNKAFVNW